MANPSDTPLQAAVRQSLGMPDTMAFTDANVRAWVSSHGWPPTLADQALQTAGGAPSYIGRTAPGAMPNIQPQIETAGGTDTPRGTSGQAYDAQGQPTGQGQGYFRSLASGQSQAQNPTGAQAAGQAPIESGTFVSPSQDPFRHSQSDTGMGGPDTPQQGWLRSLVPFLTFVGGSMLAPALFGDAAAPTAAGGTSATGTTPSLADAGIPGLAYGGAGSFGAAAPTLVGAGTAAATTPSLAPGVIGATGGMPAGVGAATVPAAAGGTAADWWSNRTTTPTDSGSGWTDILKKILPAATGLTTAALTRPSLAPGQQELNQSIAALVPYFEQLLKTQVARQTAQGPLNDQVLRMAMGQLPNWTKGGG